MVQIEEILKSSTGHHSAFEAVVNTQDEYIAMWTKLSERRVPRITSVPDGMAVDFNQYTVLVATLGEMHYIGGQELTIDTPVLAGNDLTVRVHEYVPHVRESLPSSTNPYHIVKVPKVTGSVTFNRERTQ